MSLDDSDGWVKVDMDEELHRAYEEIESQMLTIKDKMLPFAEAKYFPRHHNGHHGNDQNDENKPRVLEINHLDHHHDDDDDHPKLRAFFSPPLQFQRNEFVRSTMAAWRLKDGPISKLCVMGCGELSLERYLCLHAADLGIRTVFSVDIDDQSLANGIFLLEKTVHHNENHIKKQVGYPVNYKIYSGNILSCDSRFYNSDCVVATEVIEHMPKDCASIFVGHVLGALRPRYFILSTPNHDYNEAFDEPPGVFRHDDHKFEMTSAQFLEWLTDIHDTTPFYDLEVKYVGNKEGFEHLKGATQFAVFRLKDNWPTQQFSNEVYHLVGQVLSPIGLTYLHKRILRQAFADWVDHFGFHEEQLVQGECSKFWKVDIKTILHFAKAPVQMIARMRGPESVDTIREICNLSLYSDFSHNVDSLIIPSTVTKQQLLKYLA